MRTHSEKTFFKLTKNILSLIMQKQLRLIYRKNEVNFSLGCFHVNGNEFQDILFSSNYDFFYRVT